MSAKTCVYEGLKGGISKFILIYSDSEDEEKENEKSNSSDSSSANSSSAEGSSSDSESESECDSGSESRRATKVRVSDREEGVCQRLLGNVRTALSQCSVFLIIKKLQKHDLCLFPAKHHCCSFIPARGFISSRCFFSM